MSTAKKQDFDALHRIHAAVIDEVAAAILETVDPQDGAWHVRAATVAARLMAERLSRITIEYDVLSAPSRQGKP